MAAAAVAYLAASVSFPYWIARAYGVDLARTGSGKLGGSNLGQSVSPLAGLVGGLLDSLKGFFGVLLPRAIGLPLETQLLCGIVAIAGQMWPLFHRFDGGRGNAAGWAFALAADPIAAVIMLVPVGTAVLLRSLVRPHPTKLVPIGALASFAVFPAVIWEMEGTTPTVVAGLAVLVLIVMRRVTAGLRADLATGAPPARVLANRVFFDRSELQERGIVAL
jgi:glycerol-3-phosphate acyltransferase PlsY